MNTLEIVVWSVMLGGLLTIGTMAIVDVVLSRSPAAWRGMVFILVTGSSCMLLSGLPEHLFPDLPDLPVLILKASLGPLSGAMVLSYLGQWLGVAAEDRLVHHTLTWGSVALVAAAVIITILSSLAADNQTSEILLLAAAVNALAVLLATMASVRSAQLGDSMARMMVLGCLFMAGSLAGLYVHQIYHEAGTLPESIATAFCTVSFFLVMVSLGIRRNRQIRQLERLSGLSQGADPATGLPRGSVLLSKVDDAFWRSARLNSHCSVICLHLRNLYELSEDAGHSVDQQILASMSARMRRAVGFRCVVGLYHPRCFVVVISAVTQPRMTANVGERLRALMCKPLEVVGENGLAHMFTPQFSVGMVTVSATNAVPAQVIDEAEHAALASERGRSTAAAPLETAWQATNV
jgi:GGDEF domain-containing protein